MSKSSNEDQRISTLAEHYAQALVDATVRLEEISKSLLDNSYVKQGASSSIAEYNKGKITADKTIKLLEKIEKQMENSLKADYGIEGAGSGKSRAAINIFIETIAKRLGTSKIDKVLEEKLITAFKNFHSSLIIESMKAEERNDKKGIYYKNTMGNEKLGKVYKEFGEKIGLKLDDFKYSVTSLFQWAQAGTKKAITGLGKDLVEGLEKSKWVGGALRDTFRLIGLLGANFLSKFGTLGKVIGGAFYVAMEVAGPMMVRLLLEGMGKLLMNVPGWIGKFGWGKAAGVAAGVAGAAWAFGEAKDSWQKNRKGNAVALGTGGTAMAGGAAALGVAGLASMGAAAAGGAAAGGIGATLAGIAAALGPIGWALLAIGATVAGIAFLWKKYGDDVKKHFKENKEIYEKLLENVRFLFDPAYRTAEILKWFSDHWPWGHGKDKSDPNSSAVGIFGTGAKGASANLLKDKTDITGHLSLSKMTEADWRRADTLEAKYDEATGAIVNLGQMSQKRAAEVIKADIEAKGKNSYYEIADPSLVDRSQFKTDVADAENVYLVRGTSARVRKELQKLQSLGFDTSQAQITAGIGSLGSREAMSPHMYKDSPSGHFGTTSSVDVGYIYKNGRRASYGEYAKYLDRMFFGQSEGDHDHWAFGEFQWAKDRRKEYKQQVKVKETTDKQTNISAILKALPEAEKREFGEKLKGAHAKDNQSLLKEEEKILKDMGIEIEKETGYVLKKGKGETQILHLEDETGTPSWHKLTETMQSLEQGAGGK